MLEIVRKHIIDCMVSFVNNYQNRELMYQRLDELFLLWNHLKSQSFVKSVEDFGLDYNYFNDKDYQVICTQIVNEYPARFPDGSQSLKQEASHE